MKKLVLCALCLLLLASCSAGTQPTEQSTDVGESNREEYIELPPDETALDVPDEIETQAEQPAAKELSCKALRKDGAVYGFEMRFRRTDAIEAMLSDTENFCFGVLQRGKKRIAVPTEEIRLLPDVPTDSIVVTLLVPQGEKLRGDSVRVSFCISARADGASKALFTAQQTVDIS